MKRTTHRTKRQTAPAKRPFTVAIVTGTRAEFGIWRPVLAAIEQSDALRPKLIVTGMHLLKGFGNTVRDIETSHKIDARAPMYWPNESPEVALSRGVASLAAAYRQTNPDMVFLLGDRLEMLAAASAALAARIPIAHLHGGETAPGIWDEQIRHAITKMAHLHFCATQTAADRIIQMGEDPQRVHVVGAPALDLATGSWQLMSRPVRKVRFYRRQKMGGGDFVLLLHPSGGTDAEEEGHTRQILSLLGDMNVPFTAIGPNNDPGHRGILRAYRQGKVEVALNLPQEEFWPLIAYCSALIGNSSAGIIEAASFGVPVINIGDRQKGRERNANVIDVPWKREAIERAIKKATSNRSFLNEVARRRNLYGDGRASGRIVKVLERVARAGVPLTKSFHSI